MGRTSATKLKPMMCRWPNPSQNMNTKSNDTLPVVLPRLSTQLENLADHLARFALEFGIDDNADFPSRIATIGFANGVALRTRDREGAARLDALLASEDILTSEEAQAALLQFTKEFPDEGDWTKKAYQFLKQQWALAPDASPDRETRLRLRLRILHGIRFGLMVEAANPAVAQRFPALVEAMWVENQFLSRCIVAWADHAWTPVAPPFVEFTASCYPGGSTEQSVITATVAAMLPSAKNLNAPWDFTFWVETGWNSGRRFADSRAEDCKTLLKEASRDNLSGCHDLYRNYILGTARADGEVQIMRAVLKWFGECKSAEFARCYCSGREPRRLARCGFDFAFWMGVFASYPVPVGTPEGGT